MLELVAEQRWHSDFLGAGFQALTLPLAPDEAENEEVTATLVRATKPRGFASFFGDAAHTDVLYVHGWSDYFFQTHVADFWRKKGARFFALDLRRYGRNLSEASVGQLPGYIASLETYDEEIELALAQMNHGRGEVNRRKLILMGHSTGGLILSLWAARNPGRASALVLNSPWLELQTREVGRLALAPFVDTLSKYQPKNPIRTSEPGFYMRSISDTQDGEWSVNPDWHPNHSFPIYPGWLSAIIRGHQMVAQGLGLKIPILVLLSARSLFAPIWDEQMKSCDVVLDVTGVAKRSVDLGVCTTVVRIDHAIHDVFLSKKPVRQHAFDAIDEWLTGYGRRFDTGEPVG